MNKELRTTWQTNGEEKTKKQERFWNVKMGAQIA